MENKERPVLSIGWWRGTETPRWVLLSGAVLALGANFLVTALSDDRNRVSENRAEQVRTLLDSMVQFQVFASAFSTELFAEGRVSTETRSRLVQNLNEQFGRMAAVEAILPAEERAQIERYKSSILRMNDAISRAESVGTMQDFWSAASDLTVARNALSARLQASI